MVTNRKVILFILALIAGCVLAWKDKNTDFIVTLYLVYCGGNVSQKIFRKDNETEVEKIK